MEYRALGRTGLEVSVLGYGAGPLGNEYGDVDDDTAGRSVARAIELGINFFDTAPYYGRTLSEERLGKALVGRRQDVLLATKCCRYDFRAFDFSAARVIKSVDESLTRLRTDYIDLFQVHDVEFGERSVIENETLPALEELRAQGKVRFIGITGLPVELLREIARARAVDTVLSYCHYNLLNTEMADVLFPLRESRHVGLINASPLHMGVLTDAGPPPWHPAPEEVLATGRRLAAACQTRGTDVASVGLRFCLDQEAIATTLVGMERAEIVTANAAVLDMHSDAELLAELRQLVGAAFDRTWHEGLPENAPTALRGE